MSLDDGRRIPDIQLGAKVLNGVPLNGLSLCSRVRTIVNPENLAASDRTISATKPFSFVWSKGLLIDALQRLHVAVLKVPEGDSANGVLSSHGFRTPGGKRLCGP